MILFNWGETACQETLKKSVKIYCRYYAKNV